LREDADFSRRRVSGRGKTVDRSGKQRGVMGGERRGVARGAGKIRRAVTKIAVE
jgi:hypothetical protein